MNDFITMLLLLLLIAVVSCERTAIPSSTTDVPVDVVVSPSMSAPQAVARPTMHSVLGWDPPIVRTQVVVPLTGMILDSATVYDQHRGRHIGETGKQASIRLGIEEDVLWLARGIYTEVASDLLSESTYVGWVIRNRVETQYRGQTTYKGVVLDNKQFSAFNTRRGRARYGALKWLHAEDSTYSTHVDQARWRWALVTAFEVLVAPATERPFPATTRHYYRRHRMMRRINRHARSCRKLSYPHPAWEHDRQAVEVPVENAHHTYFRNVR